MTLFVAPGNIRMCRLMFPRKYKFSRKSSSSEPASHRQLFHYIPYNHPFNGQSLSGYHSITRSCGLTTPEQSTTPDLSSINFPAFTVHISHPIHPTLYLESGNVRQG